MYVRASGPLPSRNLLNRLANAAVNAPSAHLPPVTAAPAQPAAATIKVFATTSDVIPSATAPPNAPMAFDAKPCKKLPPCATDNAPSTIPCIPAFTRLNASPSAARTPSSANPTECHTPALMKAKANAFRPSAILPPPAMVMAPDIAPQAAQPTGPPTAVAAQPMMVRIDRKMPFFSACFSTFPMPRKRLEKKLPMLLNRPDRKNPDGSVNDRGLLLT
jgi:hypothetical protein